MRNDETTTTPVINPQHEAIAQAYYERAVVGEDVSGTSLMTLIGAQSYHRLLPDGSTLIVDIAPGGSRQATVYADA